MSSSGTMDAILDFPEAPARSGRSLGVTLRLAVVAVLIVGLLSAALGWYGRGKQTAQAPTFVSRFAVAEQHDGLSSFPPAIAPNGKRLVYQSDGKTWLRELADLEPKLLGESDFAISPFWSPDSRIIAFMRERELWKLDVNDGKTTRISVFDDAFQAFGGGAWRADGNIVICTGGSPLLMVSALGGDPSTYLDLEDDEVDVHTPSLLPDDKGVLFVSHQREGPYDTIVVFDGKIRTEIVHHENEDLTRPVYSEGHVLYARKPTHKGIWAVPFSLSDLKSTGEPFLVVPEGEAPSISQDGTLAYRIYQSSARSRPIVVDEAGVTINGIIGEDGEFHMATWSSDRNQLVVSLRIAGEQDLFLLDVERGVRQRLAGLPGHDAVRPGCFSEDRVVFFNAPPGKRAHEFRVMMVQSDRVSEPTEICKGFEPVFSPDGRKILFSVSDESQNWDLYYLELEGDRSLIPLVRTPFNEHGVQLSNSNLMAWTSNATGKDEVYIARFPDGADLQRVSVKGGLWPLWNETGDRLFYTDPFGTIMMVTLTLGEEIKLSQPKRLIDRKGAMGKLPFDWPDMFDISPDEDHFLILDPTGPPPKIVFFQHWYETITRQ